MALCYECDPKRSGGYNHKDCRDGKKSKNGTLQKCTCWCRSKSSKYVIVIDRSKS